MRLVLFVVFFFSPLFLLNEHFLIELVSARFLGTMKFAYIVALLALAAVATAQSNSTVCR